MLTLKDIESYWSNYTLGLEALKGKDNLLAGIQKIKRNHDKAYAYANSLLDLSSFEGRSVLELACGIGLDTIEFARHGAQVTAVDLSHRCIDIAKKYLDCQRIRVEFLVGNAEELCFSDQIFDIVIARGILMYTPNPNKVIEEMWRVLKPRGKAFILLHNRRSWYVFLSKLFGQNLYNETKDPPINRLYTKKEARLLFEDLFTLEICLDRFPSKAMNRDGFLPTVYNNAFVPVVKIVPQSIIMPFGYYIIVKATKR